MSSLLAFWGSIDFISIGIFALIYLCSKRWKWHPILVVLVSAALGIAAYELVPAALR